MQVQAPGYLRPKQVATLTEAQEAQIAQVCPGLGQTIADGGKIADGHHTSSVLWGPYVSMKTGWATDPAIRFAGSSGGGLSMILIHLLQEGQVDAVVQTAADTQLAIGNATVITTDPGAILSAAGSRYAPSAPLSDLAALLQDGRRFAFVGKPCDAAALRALTQSDLAAAKIFPVILSFFCAGVPSHDGGRAVLGALGTNLDQTAVFRFRGNGWPGEAKATLKDGSTRQMSYHDSWGKILSKHVQHRCKICADGIGVAADIVCADAWEADAAGYPVFSEAPGVSLIVARTPLGASVINTAERADVLTTQPFDSAGLDQIQPGQRERRRAVLARLAALRLLGRPIPVYKGFQLFAAARQNPVQRNLKNFLGTLRRALRRV
jgi:coenzyme F420 hydrogenase subunit beta